MNGGCSVGCALLRVVLPLMLTLSMVSTSPCCPEGIQMIPYHSSQDYSIICADLDPVSALKWCDQLYVELDYTEDPNRTLLILSEDIMIKSYCTGVLAKNSFKNDAYLANHTEKEVALVCFPNQEEPEGYYTVYAICLLISSVFLLATVIIYLILPELRDLQGKCVLCFIISLMIGYISLAYLQHPYTTPDTEDTKCILLAFITYFWMMSAFFWLNVNSFNMWRSAVLSHINMSEKRLMLAYYLAGWGIPLLFLVFALITQHLPGNHIQPNFGKRSCWFQGKMELWSFFYGPVLVLLILNIIYFISTARYLWSDYRSPNPMPRVKSLRIKFCLYLKLFLVMGMTWIFEILSSIDNEPWYVTDILNCFQGLIIFVVMIVLRKRVWRALAAKKLFGIQAISCWNRLDDEDTGIMDEDQLSTNNPRKPYELVVDGPKTHSQFPDSKNSPNSIT